MPNDRAAIPTGSRESIDLARGPDDQCELFGECDHTPDLVEDSTQQTTESNEATSDIVSKRDLTGDEKTSQIQQHQYLTSTLRQEIKLLGTLQPVPPSESSGRPSRRRSDRRRHRRDL